MAVRNSLTAATTVCLLGVTSGFTNLRLGSLQIEDFVLLLLLGFCIGKFIGSLFSLHISPELNGLLKAYSLLLFALLAMAVLALRLRFYALDEASLLQTARHFLFSRLLQFVAIICGFLWLTNAFIKKRSLLFLALRAYWWTGIVCSWYAIVSYCAVAALHFRLLISSAHTRISMEA